MPGISETPCVCCSQLLCYYDAFAITRAQATRTSRWPAAPPICAGDGAARAQARLSAVRARRVAGRAVRRVYLGGAARLVFAVPFSDGEAPAVLRAAVLDIGDRLRIVPDQGVTTTGSPDVKVAGQRHHCRHRWRLLMTERPVHLSLSTHHREGGQALPYLWVQGRPALVWRVAAIFAP